MFLSRRTLVFLFKFLSLITRCFKKVSPGRETQNYTMLARQYHLSFFRGLLKS